MRVANRACMAPLLLPLHRGAQEEGSPPDDAELDLHARPHALRGLRNLRRKGVRIINVTHTRRRAALAG